MIYDPENACRIALGAVFVGTAAVGIPFRVRADRAGGRVSRRVDPGWFWIIMALIGPPMVLACLAFLFAPRKVDFAAIDLPAGVRLLGVPIALLGMGLFGWMFRHLGLNVTSTSMPRENATLVTSGPYRWIRHPMYSAALILVIAAMLLTANLLVMVGGFAMFILMAARSRLEERRLVEKFGAAYVAYQNQTGRFIPRLT